MSKKDKKYKVKENSLKIKKIVKKLKKLANKNNISLMFFTELENSGYSLVNGDGKSIKDMLIRAIAQDESLGMVIQSVSIQFAEEQMRKIGISPEDVRKDVNKNLDKKLGNIVNIGGKKGAAIDLDNIDKMTDEDIDNIIDNMLDNPNGKS
tara:strand:- start:87 stop:539 length:453 start_codon:yes stop_codon:yes gene_type:complete